MQNRLGVKIRTVIVCGALLAAGNWASLGLNEPFTSIKADDSAPGESDARKTAHVENLKLMLRRAQGTTIKLVANPDRADIELIPKPLFHYSDEPRRILDATLWGWTREGRLIAVCKIEKYDHSPERTW